MSLWSPYFSLFRVWKYHHLSCEYWRQNYSAYKIQINATEPESLCISIFIIWSDMEGLFSHINISVRWQSQIWRLCNANGSRSFPARDLGHFAELTNESNLPRSRKVVLGYKRCDLRVFDTVLAKAIRIAPHGVQFGGVESASDCTRTTDFIFSILDH